MLLSDSRPGVIFVLNSLGIGGSETKIINIANALSGLGSKVEIAYLNAPETARSRIDPRIPVTHLDRRGKYSIKSLKLLSNLVTKESVCTLVAVNLYPLLYVVPSARLCRSHLVRTVGLINTAELAWPLGAVYAPLLRRCNELVFGCEAQRTLWVNKYRLPGHRSRFIYNGVDDQKFTPAVCAMEGGLLRKKLEIPDRSIVLGSVGRLAPEKSFELLIEAVARLNATGRESFAIIAGDGGQREKLERMALLRGISERVKLLGLLGDVRPAISAMDIFVLSSKAVETFSNAALEAMAMSRPVVLSNMGGAAEMVEHGESGMLFPVGDVETLTQIVSDLHDSEDFRRRLGSAARARVAKCFRFQDTVHQYQQVSLPFGMNS